ncbi:MULTISPECIES: RNA-binding domain-containing protein [Haloarcula]|uniref:RNA-binding domain-containing protein n=1 Tax=Haloarcula TaxID=2237 RepID=UPI0023EC3AD5|nr:RNA-binding domain-containing protein [Halomicroarcula sp. XH51]
MSAVYSVDVQVTAPVNDTEVTARVADAIRNLFPEADPEHSHGELRAEVHSMDEFSELLHRLEILDTARSVFFDALEGDTFAFDVKKQAAFEGRINFAVGEPAELGDIHVRVRVREPDAEAYIDYVAPPTEDGTPVDSEP